MKNQIDNLLYGKCRILIILMVFLSCSNERIITETEFLSHRQDFEVMPVYHYHFKYVNMKIKSDLIEFKCTVLSNDSLAMKDLKLICYYYNFNDSFASEVYLGKTDSIGLLNVTIPKTKFDMRILSFQNDSLGCDNFWFEDL